MGPIAALTRTSFGSKIVRLALLSTLALAACAETSDSGERRVRVIKDNEAEPEKSGISPDKQAEIQLLLQQRDPSTLRCYQDVLDEKHDRAFKGSVIVLLTLKPSGTSSAATAKVIGGTLNNKDVNDCLVSKLQEFEYPQVAQTGTMQYVYQFEPAY
ncbi:MAG TPA: hypothetical protein VHO06_01400 [Polyangia bacterium]|nr:hypothetical protein [Polyangia bacterium]